MKLTFVRNFYENNKNLIPIETHFRLEFYEQNLNLGRPECSDDEDPKMKLPILQTNRDINSNICLPPLDKTIIRQKRELKSIHLLS